MGDFSAVIIAGDISVILCQYLGVWALYVTPCLWW